jgi:hypothetical protein
LKRPYQDYAFIIHPTRHRFPRQRNAVAAAPVAALHPLQTGQAAVVRQTSNAATPVNAPAAANVIVPTAPRAHQSRQTPIVATPVNTSAAVNIPVPTAPRAHQSRSQQPLTHHSIRTLGEPSDTLPGLSQAATTIRDHTSSTATQYAPRAPVTSVPSHPLVPSSRPLSSQPNNHVHHTFMPSVRSADQGSSRVAENDTRLHTLPAVLSRLQNAQPFDRPPPRAPQGQSTHTRASMNRWDSRVALSSRSSFIPSERFDRQQGNASHVHPDRAHLFDSTSAQTSTITRPQSPPSGPLRSELVHRRHENSDSASRPNFGTSPKWPTVPVSEEPKLSTSISTPNPAPYRPPLGGSSKLEVSPSCREMEVSTNQMPNGSASQLTRQQPGAFTTGNETGNQPVRDNLVHSRPPQSDPKPVCGNCGCRHYGRCHDCGLCDTMHVGICHFCELCSSRHVGECPFCKTCSAQHIGECQFCKECSRRHVGECHHCEKCSKRHVGDCHHCEKCLTRHVSKCRRCEVCQSWHVGKCHLCKICEKRHKGACAFVVPPPKQQLFSSVKWDDRPGPNGITEHSNTPKSKKKISTASNSKSSSTDARPTTGQPSKVKSEPAPIANTNTCQYCDEEHNNNFYPCGCGKCHKVKSNKLPRQWCAKCKKCHRVCKYHSQSEIKLEADKKRKVSNSLAQSPERATSDLHDQLEHRPKKKSRKSREMGTADRPIKLE